jgi:hypothetical protein
VLGIGQVGEFELFFHGCSLIDVVLIVVVDVDVGEKLELVVETLEPVVHGELRRAAVICCG